MKGMTQNDTII